MPKRDLNAAAEKVKHPQVQKVVAGIPPIKSNRIPPIQIAPKAPRPIAVPFPPGKTRRRPAPSQQIMEQLRNKVYVGGGIGQTGSNANLVPLQQLKPPPQKKLDNFSKRDDAVVKGVATPVVSVEHRPVDKALSDALDRGLPPPPQPPLKPDSVPTAVTPPPRTVDQVLQANREPPFTSRPKLTGVTVPPKPPPPGPTGAV